MRLLILTIFGLSLFLNSQHATSSEPRHLEYPTYSAHVNGISIAYQDFGDPNDEAILLIMGLGAQLISWSDELVFSLMNEGYRIIRFDNRDSGWSEKFYNSPTPNWLTGIKFKLGLSLNAPYKLDDMAADANALLEHLQINKAHIVGGSMGGMIAQIMAAKYPERVMSLTSIMSTSGAAHLPSGSINLDFSSRGETREEVLRGTIKLVKQFGGGASELSDDEWYRRLARGYDRSHYPQGAARQLWAIIDSGDRVELLKSIRQPSVVIHGKADALVPYQGGEHTAELINDAKLVLIEGMGHHIDDANRTLIVEEILEIASRGKSLAKSK